MVIIQLVGGLGNQMFQYAVARQLAYFRKTPLRLDISALHKDPLRSYRLGYFNITGKIATEIEIARFKRLSRRRFARRLALFTQRLLPEVKYSQITERSMYYDPEAFNTCGHLYLVGYWQSYKYFLNITGILHQEFTLKHNLSLESAEIASQIHQTNSISLHIRRGDYVNDPSTNQYHGVCSLMYYQEAVDKLIETVRQPHFFIFSDDIAWTQQNLRLNYPITFVTHNGIEKDYEDLWLIRQCKNHIIANSSFSWWGAWLCTNPQKIVIAPKQWFKAPDIDEGDRIPNTWIRI
jgi:hypothetical protein